MLPLAAVDQLEAADDSSRASWPTNWMSPMLPERPAVTITSDVNEESKIPEKVQHDRRGCPTRWTTPRRSWATPSADAGADADDAHLQLDTVRPWGRRRGWGRLDARRLRRERNRRRATARPDEADKGAWPDVIRSKPWMSPLTRTTARSPRTRGGEGRRCRRGPFSCCPRAPRRPPLWAS